MSEANERSTYPNNLGPLRSLVNWLKSFTPEAQYQNDLVKFRQSLVSYGAATQLWMTELTLDHLKNKGQLAPDMETSLNGFKDEYARTMRENGGDPQALIDSIHEQQKIDQTQ